MNFKQLELEGINIVLDVEDKLLVPRKISLENVQCDSRCLNKQITQTEYTF